MLRKTRPGEENTQTDRWTLDSIRIIMRAHEFAFYFRNEILSFTGNFCVADPFAQVNMPSVRLKRVTTQVTPTCHQIDGLSRRGVFPQTFGNLSQSQR